MQATWVRAFAALESFRGEAALATWLTRIALNEALGRLRRQRPSVGLDRLDEGGAIMFPLSPVPPGPESEAGRARVRAVLERAVDSLPAPFRAVFVLRGSRSWTPRRRRRCSALAGDGQDAAPPRPSGSPRALERELAPAFGDLSLPRRPLRHDRRA